MEEALMTDAGHLQVKYPAFLRIPAKVLSYLFHPLFIPTYIFLWLSWRFSFEFSGITEQAMFFRKVSVFWMTAFFPAFSVFLLWRLKFIDSIFLKSNKERIAPYVITMIFYWWMWYLSRSFTDQPIVLKFFYLGIFIATIFGLTINNFLKISMHTMGVGGAFACVLLTCFSYHTIIAVDILIVTLITGLVSTSRLLLGDHNIVEIYLGLFIGVLSQLIAFTIVM